MNKILYLLITVLAATASFAQTKAPLEFTDVKHSFGKIKLGTPVTYNFNFKNVSDKPLVIENASAECGCTTPEFPKSAIAKGGTGKIKVTYNAALPGTFTKKVTVKVANVAEPIILNIEGEVANTGATASTAAVSAKTATASTKAKPAVSKTTSITAKTKQ